MPNNSWWPKYVASLKNPDGTMKEEVGAGYSDTITTKIIAPEEAQKLTVLIGKLQNAFTKLPEESKERVTAELLKFTGTAFYTNVQQPVESLLWCVVEAIDPTWLEENAIETSFPGVYFYGDVNKAEKLYRKQFAIQDMHYAGLPKNSNLRYILGDLLDRHGRTAEAKKWYEEARDIDDRLVRTGILEKNEYTERDYNIRSGKYTSPAKAAATR